MAKLAIINDATNLVDNIIVAPDDGSTFTPDDGFTAVPVDDGTPISIGWLSSDGQFTEPTQEPPPLSQQAYNALQRTDDTALRCFKAGVVYPAEWSVYSAELRAIYNGSDATSTSLPNKPPYPQGT